MFHGLGVETGVDLDALVATSIWMAGVLGRPSPSRVVDARSAEPGPVRQNARMARRVFLHIGAPEERHDLPPGQVRAQPRPRSPSTG